MVYLDNAATTYKKPDTVLRAVKGAIKKYSANPGRSGHRLSIRATELVYSARESISRHLNYSFPDRIVFTLNATYALNMAIKTLIPDNSHVIISDLEHNSVYRPICSLAQARGVSYSVYKSSADNIFKEIEGHIRDNTSAIVTTLKSNVTGECIPIFALSELKKKYGIRLILDASQAAGLTNFSLDDVAFDAFCAPAHKGLYGIMGLGFAVFAASPDNTLLEGGSGNESRNKAMPKELPERMEAGTLPLPAIAGLKAGVEYIDSIGIDTVISIVDYLTEEALSRLREIKNIRIYGAHGGVICFNIGQVPSEKCARKLSDVGICTRAGLHCAPLAHEKIGTLKSGCVRISLSYFNTERELDKLYRALRKI
ncbi:MAG: aminotransferase class V-fold PLP-dependent enzyme [Clostridia bacterium]|nr:aminotransferase class V-fold PLP-dependent enzyme [Clostridia bacterium]